MNYQIMRNTEYNSNEVYFDGVPSMEIRERLKGIGCRWHKVKKCWYSYKDESTILNAIEGNATESANDDRLIYETVETDGYMGSRGYKGCNYGLWHSDTELKNLLLQEYKKNGIKATIRKNRGGWTYSLTITIKADQSVLTDDFDDSERHYDGTISVNEYRDHDDRFTEDFNRKLNLIYRITSSFNRDDSNAMVDYFSCGFYTRFYVKC